MGLFGKKPEEQTVVLLDVESGSVGSALVRILPQQKLALLAQHRARVPLPGARDASGLFQKIEQAARGALVHAAEAAARIRNMSRVPRLGNIARVAVVLHPPWALLTVAEGPQSRASEPVLQALRTAVRDHLGDVPVGFHPFGAVAAYGARLAHPDKNMLLCSITGEVCEILSLVDGSIAGAATIPFGQHHVLRTLKTHGGLTAHEARSALRLGYVHEPLRAAAKEFGTQVSAVASELLEGSTRHIYVVGEAATAAWAGKALSGHEKVSALFPEGGQVSVLRTPHASGRGASGADGDSALELGSFFIGSKLGG